MFCLFFGLLGDAMVKVLLFVGAFNLGCDSR